MNSRQKAFTNVRPASRSETNRLFMRASEFQDLECAVLLGHVLVYEDLCWLLGIRLHADAMPEKLPTFSDVAALALAGTQFEEDRKIVFWLNSARNEIAHQTNRRRFEGNVRNFCTSLCRDEIFGVSDFRWKQDEQQNVDDFWFAFGILMARFGSYSDQFARVRE